MGRGFGVRIHVNDFAKHPGLERVQVTLDGEDVSNQCFEVDDREGWVRVYVLKEDGKKFYNVTTNSAAWEEKKGEVKIFLPPFAK